MRKIEKRNFRHYSILLSTLFFLCFFLNSNAWSINFSGSVSGIWTNPLPTGNSQYYGGTDTTHFEWGYPGFGTPACSVDFEGQDFSSEPEIIFSVGEISYYNGTLTVGTEATSVDLELTVDFIVTDSSEEQNYQIDFSLELETTTNDGTEWENADYVYFPTTMPSKTFQIGDTTYMIELAGFSQDGGQTILKEFHVLEDDSTTAKLYAWITEINPEAELSEIVISGPDTILQTNCALYKLTAYYNDGSTREVTEVATWSTNYPDEEIAYNGLFCIDELNSDLTGTYNITASYQGYEDTLHVNIINSTSYDQGYIDGQAACDSQSSFTGELAENVQSYLTLTEDSVPFYLSPGSYVQTYGSNGTNTLNVEEYARLQCKNFIGENEINIEEASSHFTVYRSGATVYLNSTSGTRVEIAATETPQTLRFADGSLVLEIVSGNVMLGAQLVDETESLIDSPTDESDTSESVF